MSWGVRVFVFCLSFLCSHASNHVLVTGGLGFIGSHVVHHLLDKGNRVTILDDASNGHNSNTRVNTILADISNEDTYEKLDPSINYVVHLAAAISVTESMSDPEKYNRVNVIGSRLLLEWAARNKVKRVVTASSAAVYGDSAPLPIKESSPYGGKSPYAESKWLMEQEQKIAYDKHGLQSVALRFFNVFGPRQDPNSPYSGVISKFLAQASQSQPVTIFGDGTQTRDFVYVEDVAHAIIHSLFAKLPPHQPGEDKPEGVWTYNICTGVETSISSLANMVVESQGWPKEEIALFIKHAPAREGDILRSVCDPTEMNTKLGFKTSRDVLEGLKVTQLWFYMTQRQQLQKESRDLQEQAKKKMKQHEHEEL